MIPKIKFELADIESTVRMINRFVVTASTGTGWGKIILKEYPELNNLIEKSEKEKKEEIINFFLSNKFRELKPKLEEARENFQASWDKNNSDFMKALAEINEIEWPEEYSVIMARITLNPICPRYLKQRMFDVYYKFSVNKMREIALHEISHFIFFEKWKSIFPNYDERDFESPQLIWKLSEMMPFVVLGHEKIQKIFKHEPNIYKKWHETKINKVCILECLKRIYDSSSNFEDFVKKAYLFVTEHKSAI